MSDGATTVTLDEAKVLQSETDWDALEEKTDEEIREAVESDPDAYFLDEDWFEAATFVDPSAAKERISIRLDMDILEFFRAGGAATRAVSTRCSGSTWPSDSRRSRNVRKRTEEQAGSD